MHLFWHNIFHVYVKSLAILKFISQSEKENFVLLQAYIRHKAKWSIRTYTTYNAIEDEENQSILYVTELCNIIIILI